MVLAGSAAVIMPAAAFAAGATLTNGGLGQIASDPSHFGVAICNTGKTAMNQSVPVTVALNGKTVTVTSANTVKAGACAYSYLTYGELGMQAGQSYSLTVTIDPAHTMIANANNQATYAVTVPQVPGTAAAGAPQTANVNAQSGNFFTMIANWLAGIFSTKQ